MRESVNIMRGCDFARDGISPWPMPTGCGGKRCRQELKMSAL